MTTAGSRFKAAGYRAVALVVDEDAETRELACSIAEAANLLVVAAEDSDEAIEMLQSIRIDVLVVELRARGQIDGLELAQFIQLSNPNLRVIYMTRFPQGRHLGLALGAPVVAKSALHNELPAELQHAVDLIH